MSRRASAPRAPGGAAVAVAVALVGLAACAEPEPEAPVAAAATDAETVGAEEPVANEPAPAVLAEAEGASREEAVDAARAALREQVLGAWGRQAPVALVEPGTVRVEAAGERFRARVALDEEALRALLDALPERLPRPSFGGVFAERVAPLQEAAIANLLCERRRALLEEEQTCAIVELEDAIRLAAEALRSLTLEPRWEGGVPVDAAGQPLRKPALRLRLGDAPAAGLVGLPIVVTPVGEGAPPRVGTDAEGRVDRAPLRVGTDGEGEALVNRAPGEGLVATLDRSALVPPLDAVFPELRATLRPRPVSLRRWALVLGDRTAGAFADALAESLQEHGSEPPRPLEAARGRALKAAQGARRAATLRALANERDGALDVVLVARVESHFASRMGSRRTWYEARARVDAYLVWTGESLGTFEAQANESGIGDARAERNARAKVARDLARQLAAAPALGLSRAATAAAPALGLSRAATAAAPAPIVASR